MSPTGLTVRVIRTIPTADGLELHSDIPPSLVRVVGTSPDPAQAFRSALTATVGASVRESQWMNASAAAMLAGQSLVVASNSDGLRPHNSFVLGKAVSVYLQLMLATIGQVTCD